MRHRKTKKEHGIVRKIMPNGTVSEASYVNGVMHGLRRLSSPEQVKVALMKNGQEISHFTFKPKLQDFRRIAAHNYFDQPLYELNPDYFDPSHERKEIGVSKDMELIDWVAVGLTITKGKHEMDMVRNQIAQLNETKSSLKDNQHLQVQIESLDQRIRAANVDQFAYEQQTLKTAVTEKMNVWWQQIKKVVKNQEAEIQRLKQLVQTSDTTGTDRSSETSNILGGASKQSAFVGDDSKILESRIESLEEDFAGFKMNSML
jgi:hypothetical protein